MKYEGYTGIKTVSATNYQGAMHPGFEILGIIRGSDLASKPVFPPATVGQGFQPTPSYEMIPYSAPYFVLGKPLTLVEDENLKTIAALQAKLKLAEESEKMLVNAQAENKRLMEYIESVKKEAKTSMQLTKEVRERNEQLIHDMRSVTKAFGEVAVRKVLEEG